MKRLSPITIVLIFACGCASVPRYASHTIIPTLDFHQMPADRAISHLNAAIQTVNPSAPQLTVDPSPTRVLRPEKLKHLQAEMAELEEKYRSLIQKEYSDRVEFHAREIPVDKACHIVASLMHMQAVYKYERIVFRFGPEEAFFDIYHASPELIANLKNVRPFVSSPFARWDDHCMMSLQHDTLILFVGTSSEHHQLQMELKQSRHNQGRERTGAILRGSPSAQP